MSARLLFRAAKQLQRNLKSPPTAFLQPEGGLASQLVCKAAKHKVQEKASLAFHQSWCAMQARQTPWARMSFGAGLAAAGLATCAAQADCAPATEKGQAPVSHKPSVE